MDNDIHFPFPFLPYDVQTDFMKHLYNVLETGKIGIFESPTGTGKSLSIICGALKWLKDAQEKKKKDLENLIAEKEDTSSSDWFNDFLKEQEKHYAIVDAKKEYDFLISHETYLKNLKTSKNVKKFDNLYFDVKNPKQPRYEDETVADQIDDDFDIDSETETPDKEQNEEKLNILKIYFASRTHSQLAQFLGEIKRSPYKDIITVTTLGSRSNLCVNETVSRLKNISLINEQCVEMQRNKSKSKKCCSYIKNLSDMENNILSSVKDIEDIVMLGKELKSCPYYASRNTIPKSELVILPYNILLHKPTRDAYGIVLKDNIVIIDEAHNLVEAVNNIYSAEITGMCLYQSFLQLNIYNKCYSTRFSQKNLRFIKLLLSVLQSFIQFLKCSNSAVNGTENASKMAHITDFLSMCDVGNINFFELAEFCDTSLIGRKLHGFTAARVAKGITPGEDEKKKEARVKGSTTSFLAQIKQKQSDSLSKENIIEEKSNNNASVQYRPSAFFTFIEFIKTLTFPTDDGRVLFCKSPNLNKSFLKFLHLNPSSHFQDIVNDAKSIILTGGTMQPISEFRDLFLNTGVTKDRISYFMCGHVIPPKNILAIGLATGPCGNTLDFTFKSRKLHETVKELGSILTNVCNSIQGGIVCFLPSYDYEEFIYMELNKNKVLDAIKRRKKIFREPKLGSDVDQILSQYSKAISLCKSEKSAALNGAILFSIVGGKMSEGINFSDDLGRCVVMVGLPYPNKFSIELKEKMSYLNAKSKITTAGDVYYNNLCMKAVNQSIGRAIRHRNDFATILLLDYRYKTTIVKDSLPGWILKSFVFYEKFGPAFFALRQFFSEKEK